MSAATERLFKNLSERYSTPDRVQKLVRGFPYNREKDGETLKSAYRTWHEKRAHCLEASFLAAAILEHHGYPPLVMSLESIDDLDHVLFIFQHKGRWGSIGRSREPGLHGREPVFKTLRELAMSYVDPYVDSTGRVTGFGVANLDDSGTPWRDSPKNVWKCERFLIDLPHHSLRTSQERYERALKHYERFKSHPPKSYWW